MYDASEDMTSTEVKRPRRGRRLEVRLVPLKTKDSEGSTKNGVTLDLKSPAMLSPKLKWFSRLHRRKVGIGASDTGGLELQDGSDEVVRLKADKGVKKDAQAASQVSEHDPVCPDLPAYSQTLSCFNDHEGEDIHNDKDNHDGNQFNHDYNHQSLLNENNNIDPKSDNDNRNDQLTNSSVLIKAETQPNNTLDLKPEENLSQKDEKALIWKARKKKLITYCKKFMGFLLSTLGLFILLFSYTILGGVIFHEIESPHEISIKHGVSSSLKVHVELLWNSTASLNVLNKKLWMDMASRIIDNYTREVYIATKNDGWDGNDDSEADLQWSFAGSLLYSVTVITTIGYGHIAPKTDLGRLITIFYAIFGIPLCLLSITHVGGFMATVFRFLYKNIFCGLCCFCCKKFKNRRLRPPPTATQKSDETLDGSKQNSSGCWCLRRKGGEDQKCMWSGCCRRGRNGDKDKCTPSKEGLLSPQTPHQTPVHQVRITKATASIRLHQSYKTIVKWRRGIHNALFTDDNKNIKVPIYISLLLIGGYIALGALLFGLWESEWNFLIGSYFCFITLSTIGFGDFVPGTSLDPSSSQEKLVLCTMYLIIGLALLAMCFDLMQEQARSIFRELGKYLGLISETDEFGEDVDDENGDVHYTTGV